MAKKISLKKQITPINLVDWVRLYDTEIRGNYAIEFLTAATYDTVEIPNARRYQLPPDVEDKDLDETIEELAGLNERTRSRKRRVKECWNEGRKPWAIKCLDELRENSEYRIDLLNPRLYDRTHSTGSNIPFAIDILPNLVYLYTSVLISGCSSEMNPHIKHPNPKGISKIYPSSRLPKEELEAKIEGIYTEERGANNGVGLKQPYANILLLLGMPLKGKLSRKKYDELGLGFIEKLVSWVEKKRLNKKDEKHARKALYRFMEAFMDHRYNRYVSRTYRGGKTYETELSQFHLPGFTHIPTRDKFTDFFIRVWNIVNPDIELRKYDLNKLSGKRKTYSTILYVKSEYSDRLESRFAA